MLVTLRLDCKVDHDDRILLDDADQQNHTNCPDDVELGVEQHECQQGAELRRRATWVEVTFIQNAENDIDGGNRRGDQDRLVAEGSLKDLGSTGETCCKSSGNDSYHFLLTSK